VKGLYRLRGAIAAAVLFLPCSLFAQQVQLSSVVSGLSSPLFVGHAGDGSNRLFIVERAGIIRVVQPGASASTVFLDIRAKVLAGSERGLLGLAFHPLYAGNGRFFVYYTRADDGTIVLSEYRVSGNPDVAGTAEKVLLTIPHPTYANHNGGMLAFGPDGYLYAGVGDGGGGNDPLNNAQNLNTLLGKILRIDINPPSGSSLPYISPPDNPFAGATAGRDEIFAYGMRNPWRFSFDRLTGRLWVGDVGQNAREEVDSPIVKGGNYGWRVYEGFTCTGNDPSLCSPAAYRSPLFDYAHINGRCSVTGGYVYRGSKGVLPAGTYVYGDFCTGEIFAWNGSTQRVLLDTTLNISSFGEDEMGELYVVNLGGTISRLDADQPVPGWTFTAKPSTIQPGQSSVLSFTTSTANVHNVFINGQRPAKTCGASSCSGSLTVVPPATTTYTLRSINSAGTPYPPLTVQVTVSAGTGWTFTANPATIQAGQSSVLSFTTTATDLHSVFINGQRPAYTCSASSCSGSLTVRPLTTTNYTLTSKNSSGTPYPALRVTVSVD
jgi:hypothetical protein